MANPLKLQKSKIEKLKSRLHEIDLFKFENDEWRLEEVNIEKITNDWVDKVSLSFKQDLLHQSPSGFFSEGGTPPEEPKSKPLKVVLSQKDYPTKSLESTVLEWLKTII